MTLRPSQMKPLASCSCIVGVTDAGTRRVVRELLSTLQLPKVEYCTDSDAVVYLLKSIANPDLVIVQRDLPMGGCLAVAKFVRWDRLSPAKTIPIIAVGFNWTRDQVVECLNAGISEVMGLPASLHTIQRTMLSGLYSDRAFVSTTTYCGPDRRRNRVRSYQGPFRRLSDQVSQQINEAAEKLNQKKVAALNAKQPTVSSTAPVRRPPPPKPTAQPLPQDQPKPAPPPQQAKADVPLPPPPVLEDKAASAPLENEPDVESVTPDPQPQQPAKPVGSDTQDAPMPPPPEAAAPEPGPSEPLPPKEKTPKKATSDGDRVQNPDLDAAPQSRQGDAVPDMRGDDAAPSEQPASAPSKAPPSSSVDRPQAPPLADAGDQKPDFDAAPHSQQGGVSPDMRGDDAAPSSQPMTAPPKPFDPPSSAHRPQESRGQGGDASSVDGAPGGASDASTSDAPSAPDTDGGGGALPSHSIGDISQGNYDTSMPSEDGGGDAAPAVSPSASSKGVGGKPSKPVTTQQDLLKMFFKRGSK